MLKMPVLSFLSFCEKLDSFKACPKKAQPEYEQSLRVSD